MYIPFFTTAGQPVELLCNTSICRAHIIWTYDTGDPYVQYVLWNSRIDSDKSRLSVKTTGGNFHSLFISDVRLSDSGLYNCYGEKGLRKAAYQLIVNGM